MRLKENYIVQDVAGETVIVPLSGGFNGIARGHGCSDFILACLKEDIDEDALVEKILEKYDVSREKAAQDVKKFLSRLRQFGALEE